MVRVQNHTPLPHHGRHVPALVQEFPRNVNFVCAENHKMSFKRARTDDSQATIAYTQSEGAPAAGAGRKSRLMRTKTVGKITGAPGLNKLINKAIMRSLETKERQATRGESTADPVNQQITDLDVYDILPQIAQGSGEGSRIGNRVRPVSLTVKVQLYCYNLGNTIPPTYFDVYLFKLKNHNQSDGLPTLFDMQKFLQDGNTVKGYAGAALDGLRPVNTDKFTLVAKRRVTLFNPFNNTGQLSSTAFLNPATTLYFDVTKSMKKTFIYDDNTSLAENDSLFIAVGATMVNGVVVGGGPAFTVGEYRVISSIKYKDA